MLTDGSLVVLGGAEIEAGEVGGTFTITGWEGSEEAPTAVIHHVGALFNASGYSGKPCDVSLYARMLSRHQLQSHPFGGLVLDMRSPSGLQPVDGSGQKSHPPAQCFRYLPPPVDGSLS